MFKLIKINQNIYIEKPIQYKNGNFDNLDFTLFFYNKEGGFLQAKSKNRYLKTLLKKEFKNPELIIKELKKNGELEKRTIQDLYYKKN